MGGFSLDGVYGRIPCPHCGSTDCMGILNDALVCSKKEKPVTAELLWAQAQKHDLSLYESILPPGLEWEFHLCVHVGKDDRHNRLGEVELYNESHGVRGVCPDLATARLFVATFGQDTSAYYKPETVLPPSPITKINLLGWYSDGLGLTQALLRQLAGQGVGYLGEAAQAVVVSRDNKWWVMWDNGGEICVEKVNGTDEFTSVPSTVNHQVCGQPLTIGTIAYRILCAMKGEQINYDWRADDEPIYAQ